MRIRVARLSRNENGRISARRSNSAAPVFSHAIAVKSAV